MKKLSVHLLIVLILTGVFCDGYFSISCISNGRLFVHDNEVYAYYLPTGFEPISSDDLTSAFRAYCRSRDLTYEGSLADAVTSVSSAALQRVITTLGIPSDELQAECYKKAEGNLGARWLFTITGVNFWNRIFAQLLQDYDLEVGQEDINKMIYSGKYFTDDDGNSCAIWILNINATLTTDWGRSISEVQQYGSYLKYSGADMVNFYNAGVTSVPYSIGGSVVNCPIGRYYRVNNYNVGIREIGAGEFYPYRQYSNKDNVLLTASGNPTVFYHVVNKKYYFGVVTTGFRNNLTTSNTNQLCIRSLKQITVDDNNSTDTEVDVTSSKIKEPLTVPEGEEYIEIDDNGESGGGSDPDQPTPSGPEIPDWHGGGGTGTIGSDGTFDFDIPFTLPDLNIDWSLKNIGDKFPFCIPSDIVSFYQTLAVEPRAPAIDAHIPLGNWYDWHFEADFSQYDNWARIIRAVEYIGFVIGLIYFTIKLVKG